MNSIKKEALKLFPPFDDTGENSLMRQARLDAYEACARGEAVQALVRALEHVRDCWSSDLKTLPKYAESELQKWAERSMAKGE